MMEAQRCIYNAKIEESRLQNWLKMRSVFNYSTKKNDELIDEETKIDQSYAQYKKTDEIPCVTPGILRNGVDNYVRAVRNHRHNSNHWHKPRLHREARTVYLTRDMFEFRAKGLWIGRPSWPVGFLNMKAHRTQGLPASIRIRETASGRWYVSFSYDDLGGEPLPEKKLKKQIKAEGEGALDGKVLGIDRGLRQIVALSSGVDLGLDQKVGCRRMKRLQAKVRRLKRKLRRQRDLQSERRKKTRRILARTEERLEDFRRDAYRKVVHHLVQEPTTVFVMEDLQIASMRRDLLSRRHLAHTKEWSPSVRRGVARGLLQARLAELARLLQSAARRAGKLVLLVSPHRTSTTCSNCGHHCPENRPRCDHFECVACHLVLDPDVNAARNIARRGLDLLFKKPPAGQAGAKARGGVDRPARGTAPKSGESARRNEKSPRLAQQDVGSHATKKSADLMRSAADVVPHTDPLPGAAGPGGSS